MASSAHLRRLDQLLGSGVPGDALVFYGRWFQFETWLRETVYIELRAKYGFAWAQHLSGPAPKRIAKDERNQYMATADADDLLAYADFADLLGLVDDHWALFEAYLLPQRRWEGRVDELRELRNRNAHCRRPHRDDVGRVEQTLRDLEPGARRFYRSYVETLAPAPRSRDPLVEQWGRGKHDTASRLLEHAARQYGVRFGLSYAVRPWAAPVVGGRVSGHEGAVWHARWIISERHVSPAALWGGLGTRAGVTDRIFHLLIEGGTIIATFSALDDPMATADAIGVIFDEMLMVSDPLGAYGGADNMTAYYETLRSEVARLPARVQMTSALTLTDPSNPDAFTIFGA